MSLDVVDARALLRWSRKKRYHLPEEDTRGREAAWQDRDTVHDTVRERKTCITKKREKDSLRGTALLRWSRKKRYHLRGCLRL